MTMKLVNTIALIKTVLLQRSMGKGWIMLQSVGLIYNAAQRFQTHDLDKSVDACFVFEQSSIRVIHCCIEQSRCIRSIRETATCRYRSRLSRRTRLRMGTTATVWEIFLAGQLSTTSVLTEIASVARSLVASYLDEAMPTPRCNRKVKNVGCSLPSISCGDRAIHQDNI